MSDATTPVFTEEELHRQARGNAGTLPYLVVALAKAWGHPPEEGAAFVGQAFAAGWEELRDQGALVVVRMMALNLASLGGEVRGITGDQERAEARIAGYPTAEDAVFFGVSRDETDQFFGSFRPIAAHLGLRADWRREDDELVLTVDASPT